MLKQFIMYIAFVSLFGVLALAQDQPATDKSEKKECAKSCCSGHRSHGNMTMAHMESDSTHSMHQMKSNETDEASIVREGEIDLAAIDKNQDGEVYQDQMCWNVISDEPGECPQCGMILKEVTLDEAKINLEDNGYDVKTE